MRQAVATALLLYALPVLGQVPAPTVPAPLSEAIRFTISEIRVEGNTLVASEELLAAVRPYLGSGKRLEDLGEVRRALLAAYRARGYELLSVDYLAARSRAGIHYFAVREVRLGRITVTGQKALTEEGIRGQLPSLKEGGTPKLGPLARELFLFNDNPGRSATLEYASSGPGVTDVTVKIAEQPQLRAAVFLNNTGTSATGTTRAGLHVAHSNLLGLSHQAGATVSTSPERPERVFQAGLSYFVPLPALGDGLAFSASYSDVDSGRVAEFFTVSGKGSAAGAHYQRNLARDATSRHLLDFGYDERRYRDVIDFFGTNLGVSVTAKPVSAGYRYSRLGAGSAFAAGVTVQQNVRGGRNNDDATYARARAGADASWRNWQFDGAWQREFASGWMPSARVAGQYANEPHISGEQFGPGGSRGVRGFDEREGAADRGWRASLELHGPRFAQGHRLLGFVDVARTHRINALSGETSTVELASVGAGWRWQLGSRMQASADLAYVLDGTPRHAKGHTMLHVFGIFWF